jgi:hypothetical protein
MPRSASFVKKVPVQSTDYCTAADRDSANVRTISPGIFARRMAPALQIPSVCRRQLRESDQQHKDLGFGIGSLSSGFSVPFPPEIERVFTGGRAIPSNYAMSYSQTRDTAPWFSAHFWPSCAPPCGWLRRSGRPGNRPGSRAHVSPRCENGRH